MCPGNNNADKPPPVEQNEGGIPVPNPRPPNPPPNQPAHPPVEPEPEAERQRLIEEFGLGHVLGPEAMEAELRRLEEMDEFMPPFLHQIPDEPVLRGAQPRAAPAAQAQPRQEGEAADLPEPPREHGIRVENVAAVLNLMGEFPNQNPMLAMIMDALGENGLPWHLLRGPPPPRPPPR